MYSEEDAHSRISDAVNPLANRRDGLLIPRRPFDRRLMNLEFHGSRFESEGVTMDFKNLIADLAAKYRRLTEPSSSSSLATPGQVVDVDAAHEAGRKAGYEAGYKKGYDEGHQVGLAAKTLPEPSGPKAQSELPSEPSPTSLSLYERLGGVYSISTVIDDAELPLEPSPTSLSLYERLGGVYSIATVIDEFIDRIMIDPRLNANPRVDEAHHRVPPAGFKYLVTEMLCWAAGGPQKYTGRAMKESHQQLMITAAEWESFLDDLQQTLDKFAVPEAEQAEIKAIIGSTRADIVM
jgi:hemoglobin